jgi:transketolase
MNGIALHGGFIPYGGTFLTFSTTRATRCAWPR